LQQYQSVLIFIVMTNLATTIRKPRMKQIMTEGQTVNNRSRVTTGRSAFACADGRGPWGRRFKDLLYLHCDDLGGAATLSECQLSLVRRMATLEIELEKMEGELAEGKPVSLDLYGRLSGHLRRLVETAGVRRVKKDVTPRLHAYVKRHVAKEEQAREAAP